MNDFPSTDESSYMYVLTVGVMSLYSLEAVGSLLGLPHTCPSFTLQKKTTSSHTVNTTTTGSSGGLRQGPRNYQKYHLPLAAPTTTCTPDA